jgi:probable rRNA maturation factor
MFTFQYFHIPRTLSRDYCTRALKALEKLVKKPQQGIINLIVIGPEEIARMNKQFRGKEWPTDILTFSFIEKVQSTGDMPQGMSSNKVQSKGILNDNGIPSTKYQVPSTSDIAWEIYLCLEKIKIYAKERGHTYQEELEFIVIHGLVHLMGYDHEDEKETMTMEWIEKKIIQSLHEL